MKTQKKRLTGRESRAKGRAMAMEMLDIFAKKKASEAEATLIKLGVLDEAEASLARLREDEEEQRVGFKIGDRVVLDDNVGTVIEIDETNSLHVQVDIYRELLIAPPFCVRRAKPDDERALTNDQKRIHLMIQDHAIRDDFEFTVISTSGPTVLFENCTTGKVYKVSLEEMPDPRKKRSPRNRK